MVLSKNENAYFAACNSGRGFVSFFSDCFGEDNVERLFILKGGPGTGKSRFLRRVAERGAEKGWRSELIYCSSDASSLDGVILRKGDRSIGLVDGTAPHVFDCVQPGFHDNIVDLGRFWDSAKLASRREEIADWNQRKKAAYREGYRFLTGYEEMHRLRDGLVLRFVRKSNLSKLAKKVVRDLPTGSGFSCKTALRRAFSMDGGVTLDSLFFQAKKVYQIEDCHGIARHFTDEICKIAQEKEQPIRVSKDPILPDFIDAIFFSEAEIGFVVQKDHETLAGAKPLRMRKLLDTAAERTVRSEVTYAERMMRAMAFGAEERMASAKTAHFALEKIYGDAMDFSAKETFTESFCKDLFGDQ